MTYAQTRDDEQLDQTNHDIDDFITRFQAHSPATRRTVILFPGGMGSKLKQANTRYVDNRPGPQTFTYKTIWLNAGTIFLNWALRLRMQKDAQGLDRDLGNRIIVADGPVELFGAQPYDDFVDWCDDKGIDWFILGWDWRRPVGDAAQFFISRFLPHFRQRVIAAGLADPLAKFTLIGHSAGGMVVNSALRTNHAILGTLDRAITVATPFYGYGGQLHRWYEGEELLNGPGNTNKMEMKRVIASLSGCYELLYLSSSTFAADGAALAADEKYPLDRYPCTDPSLVVDADPYAPGPHPTDPNKVRYPPATGFAKGALAQGRTVVEALVQPLPAALEAKFFNIRGVRTKVDTVGSVTWDWLSPVQFDQEPVTDVSLVPGDDTQPAWSARLATLPANQIITVEGPDINHMFIMNCPETLAELGTLLGV
jgi:hypothetical protein